MKTPAYIFSKKEISESCEGIKKLLTNCDIHYAVKANSCSMVLREVFNCNLKFECASYNEVKKVINIGCPVENIIFGLPIKSEELIKKLYSLRINYFVFDNKKELAKLIEYAPNSYKILRISVVDLDKENIPYGMKNDEITNNKRILKEISGISFHLSKNNNIIQILRALDRVEQILKLCDSTKGKIVNIGGGFCKDTSKMFYEVMNKKLEYLINKYNVKIYAEPGKWIVNTAGIFLTTVLMIKNRGKFWDLYIDGGRPNGINRIVGSNRIVNLTSQDYNLQKKMYRIVDTTCLHSIIGIIKTDMVIREGDILGFKECGAYTKVYENEFHLWDKSQVILGE